MSRRESLNWLVAAVISLAAHAALILDSGAPLGVESPTTPQRNVTRVSFRSEAAPTPESAPVPEKPVQRPPEPKKVKEKPPEPLKPEPKPIPEPKPAPKPKPEPEPEPAQEEVRDEPMPVAPSAPPTVAQAASPEPVAVGRAPAADPALLEQARQAYLAKLMAHIEAHKHYPKAARRRGIEGEVSVTFTIMAGGAVEGLRAEGAHSVLGRAAEDAVRASTPLPAPPETMSLPLEISFGMVFALR